MKKNISFAIILSPCRAEVNTLIRPAGTGQSVTLDGACCVVVAAILCQPIDGEPVRSGRIPRETLVSPPEFDQRVALLIRCRVVMLACRRIEHSVHRFVVSLMPSDAFVNPPNVRQRLRFSSAGGEEVFCPCRIIKPVNSVWLRRNDYTGFLWCEVLIGIR